MAAEQSVTNGVNSTSNALTITAPTAGKFIITALSVDKNSGTITEPSGFTLGNSYVSSSVSGAWAWKISDGTETSVSWSYATSHMSNAWAGVYPGLTSSPVDQTATANSGASAVGTQTSGTTATTSQADEVAIAMFGADSTFSGTYTYSNSFVQISQWDGTATIGAGFPMLAIAELTLTSTQTAESTITMPGGNTDQAVGWIVTLKVDTGGGSQTLTASRFDNTNSFYAATVSTGAVSLTPALFTNTNTFYSATVSNVGDTQTLTPSLFTNSNTFYAATVSLSLIVDHMLSGAITDTTARIIARLSGETTDATIEYSVNSDFTSSNETNAVNVTSSNDLIADFNLTGLTANTQYYYRVVINGTPYSLEGKFKTYVIGQYSFNFAFSGDAEIVDTNDVYNRITARTPLFFFALGDTPYTDYNNTFYEPYQDAYKAWFGAAYVKNMLANIPYQYVWDDHDFCGNDSDSTAQGKPYVQSVYRQHIPHYPLEVSDSIYHAFTVGRVRFIVTDLRSERSGSTFMGTSQMTWFKAEISAVASDPNLELIVWASSSPYIASSGTDSWFGAAAQRVEIADHIASVNMQNNFCIISADAHMVAADDGTNSDYSTSVVGGFPVFHSAPLNRSNSTKGGPYSEGTFSSTIGQYSIMSVVDNGNSIDVNVKGYDNTDTQLYSLDFSAPVISTLTPSLFSNTNTFYSATVSLGGAPQTLTPGLFTNTNAFYTAVLNASNTLTPSLYSNTNTFYAHTVTASYTIAPSLFNNSNQFFSASVTVGAVNISPALFTNSNTFYSHIVSVDGGPTTLLPDLFTNSNVFYTHSISASYTLTPSIYNNSNTFYSPTVTSNYLLTASRFDNTNQLFSATVIADQLLVAGLFSNTNVFYSALVAGGDHDQYPLAGLLQGYPLTGIKQLYPLE